MAVTNLNYPVKVSTDRDLMQIKIAQTVNQVFLQSAKLMALNAALTQELGAGSKSYTWHWEGRTVPTTNGTNMAYKAKGADRVLTTTPKELKNIEHEDPLYYTEGFDWHDANVYPTWDVVGPAIKRGITEYIESWETRAMILLGKAAQAAAVTGVHAGGIAYSPSGTEASLAGKYANTAAGGDALINDIAYWRSLKEARKEAQGMNWVAVMDPYAAMVISRSERFMNRNDFNPQANLPMGTYGFVEGMPVVVSKYMPSTAVTSDPISKYNYDLAIGGANLGQPAVLFIGYDESTSPIGQVRHGGPRTDVWWNEDEDVNKAGTKAVYGLDTLHVWNAGGIFIHS